MNKDLEPKIPHEWVITGGYGWQRHHYSDLTWANGWTENIFGVLLEQTIAFKKCLSGFTPSETGDK